MTDRLVFAVVAAVTAGAPAAVYFFCLRPSLLWRRAKWTAHAVAAFVSVVPAGVLISRTDAVPILAIGWLASMGIVAAWFWPVWLVRLTGGVAEGRGELDTVSGYLNPAGRFLDVGDLTSAADQVDEARRHSTVVTRAYVDLWDRLIEEEHLRRNGQEVSRLARLEQISAEYSRLVLGSGRIGDAHAWVAIAVVGAVAAIATVVIP